MKKMFYTFLFAFVLVSCNDEAEKAATELCDCFSSDVKKASSDFKKLMKKIAKADVPSVTFKKEFEKLDEETQASVRVEIDKLIETDEATVAKCTKKIADYKIKGETEADRAKKIVELMSNEKGCEVGSGQWALAVEQTYKNGKTAKDDEETNTDDEERPKRKVADEEEEEQ